jgi:hypothetical protein
VRNRQPSALQQPPRRSSLTSDHAALHRTASSLAGDADELGDADDNADGMSLALPRAKSSVGAAAAPFRSLRASARPVLYIRRASKAARIRRPTPIGRDRSAATDRP